ncbi:MAG: penicillin-insensitive murein endopeptidase [Polyangiales bacterium]
MTARDQRKRGANRIAVLAVAIGASMPGRLRAEEPPAAVAAGEETAAVATADTPHEPGTATSVSSAPKTRSWEDVHNPVAGKPRSIGAHGGGCLAGAARLALDGDGYHVVSPGRRRYFGHPALVDFVRSLGAAAQAEGVGPLVVGDLGLPRGGPQPNGHASHQSGLDVDLWYAPRQTELPEKLDARARRSLQPIDMVDGKHSAPNEHFDAKITHLLELASNDPRVDRIFVNPVLKRSLCAAAGDHAWLHKLRPWWGHSEHFHVRLACPKDSPMCKSQPALSAGDGCAEVSWWFSAAAAADRDAQHKDYQTRVASRPPLPEACEDILAAADESADRHEKPARAVRKH